MLKKVVFLFFPYFLFGFSLLEKIESADVGDYIISYQESTYTLLSLFDKNEKRLILEELSLPSSSEIPKNWKNWVSNGATNASSHRFWVIDKKDPSSSFVYFKGEQKRIFLKEGHFGWIKMLQKPLMLQDNSLRKKIGPPMQEDGVDHRAIWQPKWTFLGKSQDVVSDVYTFVWEADNTFLSNEPIEIYFVKNFSLPIWIEAKTAPFHLILHAVDSGKNLYSSPCPTNFLP